MQPFLNALRRFLQPTLRGNFEDSIRDALRRYADRSRCPDLCVYVSSDLVPTQISVNEWASDECNHLERFTARWAEDHSIGGRRSCIKIIVLDTAQLFVHVKLVRFPVSELAVVREPGPIRDAPPTRKEVAPPSKLGPDDGDAPTELAGASKAVVQSGTALFEFANESNRQGIRVRGGTVLGRTAASDVTLIEDSEVSRRHARLVATVNDVVVVDLGSRNGTFVNDQRIRPADEIELKRGDRVRVGRTELIYTGR